MESLEKTAVNCQRCGTENPAHRAACFNCGTILLTDSGAAEAREEQLPIPQPPEQAQFWQVIVGVAGVAGFIYLLWHFVIAPSMNP